MRNTLIERALLWRDKRKQKSIAKKLYKRDYKRYLTYSFGFTNNDVNEKQLEARIVFHYHALDEEDVPVRQSAHYEWYTVLKDDIEKKRLKTDESTISLEVIRAMEKALNNHQQRKQISS